MKTKVCPMLIGKKANPLCIGEYCAWWCKFAEDCSVPLIAGILADSSICQNGWNNPELWEGEG